MRKESLKNAMTITSFVCGFGAFGAFFRWLQTQAAFDAATGLIKGSILNILIPLLILGACAVFYTQLKKLKTAGFEPTDNMYATFRGKSIFFLILTWVIAAFLVLGGLLSLLGTAAYLRTGLDTTIALLAVFTGICFPMICTTGRARYAPQMVCIFMTLPIILFCLWLISCYKLNANNPNIWRYAVEILAVCSIIVAFYYSAGYPYGKVQPWKAMFATMLGAFMCFMTLADNRQAGAELIMIGTAGMLLMENWMMVSNMPHVDKPAQEERTSAESEAAAETENIIPNGDEEIIPAGQEPTIPEPTKQAPERKKKDSADEDDGVSEIIREYKK